VSRPADELRAATQAMWADPRLKEALLPQIARREPAKAELLAWRLDIVFDRNPALDLPTGFATQ